MFLQNLQNCPLNNFTHWGNDTNVFLITFFPIRRIMPSPTLEVYLITELNISLYMDYFAHTP